MTAQPPLQALRRRVRHYVEGALTGSETEDFDALAWAVFDHQAERCPVRSPGLATDRSDWRHIPAVPVDLFKRLRVGGLPKSETPFVFRTSGTTTGIRGHHYLTRLDLYDLGSLAWMRACVPDAPGEVVALLDDPTLQPDSSLSHMVALFEHETGHSSWHTRQGHLNTAGLKDRLADLARPAFVATTSFALDEWLHHAPPPLPDGSVLMVTGGFKGRRHRLDGPTLYAEARRLLNPGRIVTEYGMTELSSQLWGTPESPYLLPPWLRCVAVDPRTGSPLPDGVQGQLKFVDLCNVDAAVAIETLDEGVIGGPNTVTLLGRLPGAPARGCSLNVEEAWEQR